MQLIHIQQTGRPVLWPSSSSILKAGSLTLMVLALVLVSGSEAIVKQQQQQRSDNSQEHQQSAYNNHQQQSTSQVSNSLAQSSQPTYSSSISISSSSSSAQGVSSAGSSQVGSSSGMQPMASPSSSSLPSSAIGNQAQQRASSDHSAIQYSPSALSSSSGNGQSSNQKYMVDQMTAAASNPEQSYQAAANSVNMALASSGIYGSAAQAASGYSQPSGQQQQQQQQQGSQVGSNQSPQSLNPLHYFYYPAKDSGPQVASSSGAAAGPPNKPSMDALSNSVSNNYQPMAAFPSYADQLSSALSSMGAEAAASNSDPSYLPQPGVPAVGDNMGGNQQQQLIPQYNGPNQGQQGNGQQQQGGSAHQFGSDLSGYLNNIPSNSNGGNGQQHNSQGSSISFNGPTSGGPSGDYLNSHMGNQQQQHQHQPPSMNSFQGQGGNLYNQMGDLSTSNFGNNAGGLSSVASYMSPSQQPPQQQQQQAQHQHDLFSGPSSGLLGGQQQFNSAASQLSPSAVSPPLGGSQGASSLFGAASSLFGQQQAGNGASIGGASAGNSNNLFANQHYLSSFLAPQQFGQTPQLGDQASLLGAASSPLASSALPSASASAPTSVAGGGKKYGIGSFIMPMLALAGLSLLIPTMSNIGTAVGRKKRSIEDRASSLNRRQQIAFDSMNGESQVAKETSIGEYMDKIERYYSIYKNAVENDDCLNRLICEFGDAVKDVTGKSAVVTVIEKLVPTSMTGKVHLFKEAALDHKEGKEKCKKYICQSSKHQQQH